MPDLYILGIGFLTLLPTVPRKTPWFSVTSMAVRVSRSELLLDNLDQVVLLVDLWMRGQYGPLVRAMRWIWIAKDP